MAREHELKCWPEPFQAAVDGTKTHEWRKDDRGYAVGDVLVLNEWDPTPTLALPPNRGKQSGGYSGRSARFEVTYVSRGQFGIPADHVVLSIRKGQQRGEEGKGIERTEAQPSGGGSTPS